MDFRGRASKSADSPTMSWASGAGSSGWGALSSEDEIISPLQVAGSRRRIVLDGRCLCVGTCCCPGANNGARRQMKTNEMGKSAATDH
mmetsp:Transcript_96256/g.201108  ORF Transcript_96256/g.201108 Transcript_96256/m.201108 type:complete len:88 (-) Transcript_96256:595-858(-)|eukprot:CAMPEP_0206482008 /NCGR_PEP_ID=MMETSP0324_2-20121206/38566_1 /ASSEMBLY_ACC=CAM_ASM_000836 /TAXON_ID=2866 /ORGANISM="Crypthecodinium cohnii, Strain Seligo" /LENGTH=87 /DNA_ID=CAMNT_0053959769 /DNA_START=108 /DNA_END=371 /DNA_ORIENTATION=+